MAHYLNGHDCSIVNLEPSVEITHASGAPSVGKAFNWPWHFPVKMQLEKLCSFIREYVIFKFIVGFIFVFSRSNGKLQRPIRAKKDITCLDTAELINRVCSLRSMNREESNVKVGSITVIRSSKCPPRQWSTTTMTLNCISPLRRALPLSFPVRKGCCFKHQRHT